MWLPEGIQPELWKNPLPILRIFDWTGFIPAGAICLIHPAYFEREAPHVLQRTIEEGDEGDEGKKPLSPHLTSHISHLT